MGGFRLKYTFLVIALGSLIVIIMLVPRSMPFYRLLHPATEDLFFEASGALSSADGQVIWGMTNTNDYVRVSSDGGKTWGETSFKPRNCMPYYFSSGGRAIGNSYIYAVNSDTCWVGDVAVDRGGLLVNPYCAPAGNPEEENVIKTSALSTEEALVATYRIDNKQERFVYKTNDTGTTWNRYPLPAGALADTMLPLNSEVFWVGQFRTLDGGASWEKIVSAPTKEELQTLGVDSLIMSYGGFFNSCGRMRLIESYPSKDMTNLGVVITMNKKLLLFRFESGVSLSLSKDRGASWQPVSNSDALQVEYLHAFNLRADDEVFLLDAQCFVDESTFFIGYYGELRYQLFRHGYTAESPLMLIYTHDGGATWQEPSSNKFSQLLYSVLLCIMMLLFILSMTLYFRTKSLNKSEN